jgi:hypothetical protein
MTTVVDYDAIKSLLQLGDSKVGQAQGHTCSYCYFSTWPARMTLLCENLTKHDKYRDKLCVFKSLLQLGDSKVGRLSNQSATLPVRKFLQQ